MPSPGNKVALITPPLDANPLRTLWPGSKTGCSCTTLFNTGNGVSKAAAEEALKLVGGRTWRGAPPGHEVMIWQSFWGMTILLIADNARRTNDVGDDPDDDGRSNAMFTDHQFSVGNTVKMMGRTHKLRELRIENWAPWFSSVIQFFSNLFGNHKLIWKHTHCQLQKPKWFKFENCNSLVAIWPTETCSINCGSAVYRRLPQ